MYRHAIGRSHSWIASLKTMLTINFQYSIMISIELILYFIAKTLLFYCNK